jgi:protein kinase-like protein
MAPGGWRSAHTYNGAPHGGPARQSNWRVRSPRPARCRRNGRGVPHARYEALQRDVAIKIIPDALANDAVARGRFETEARAVASLSHPNIIAIHDFGQDGTVAYAVMDLLDGRTLRDLLADGPLAPRKAIDYGAQIAAGLAAAHARGVVHRDPKPENVARIYRAPRDAESREHDRAGRAARRTVAGAERR